MLPRALHSAAFILREPRLIMLSAVSSIGCDALLGLVGFDWAQFATLSRSALTLGILIVLARAWFGLTIAATAVAILRRRRSAPFLVGVSVFHAFGVLFVSFLPLVPFFLGSFLMIVPSLLVALVGSVVFVVGIVLLASYSFAGLMVIDRGDSPLAALEASAFQTRGYRGEIIGLLLLIAVTGMVAMWLDVQMKAFFAAFEFGPPIAALLHLALRVMLDLFGTCAIAALYYELDKVGMEPETAPRIPRYRGY
jgi:hypothetical protein